MNYERRAEDFVSQIGNAVRDNPVSAALIGMGVLWLIAGGASSARGGSLFGQLPDAARDTMDVASGGFRSTMERASSGVASAGDALTSATSAAYSQAAERFRALPDVGSDMFGSARANLSDLFEAQPLALGVIGLGIGASIAAALPATDIEESYLGETSDRLRAQSMDFVGEKLDQAVQTAEDVVGAMASEAEKQGLTKEGLQSAVGQVSEKVSRVASSAMSPASDAAPSSQSGSSQAAPNKPASNKPGSNQPASNKPGTHS